MQGYSIQQEIPKMTSKSKTPKSNQVDDSAAILLSAEEQLAALLSGNAGVGGIPSMLDAAISKADKRVGSR